MSAANGSNGHNTLVVLPPKRMGRPPKRNPAVIEAICASIRSGATREASAKAAGIGRSTLNEWQHDFPDISAAIERAEGEMITIAVGVIAKAAQAGNWAAAAWMLERRYPQDYGRRTIFAGDSEQAGMRFTLNIGEREAVND